MQGRYLSDRVMMAWQDSLSKSYHPMFTVAGHLNITRMLGILMEVAQTEDGAVDFDRISEWVK